ncbi:MAG TPA: GNAT family N-acetyltransferase [Candidatus Binatia bacterium]|nr:GNAT family N-acetyltransferase [Candidatus Binatia bacterium]
MADETAEKLQREHAGTYRTADGRFTVEQSSSGWMLLDAEQVNELGLPLARGPFPTLDEARAAIPEARTGPAPSAPTPIRPAKKGEGSRAASKAGGRAARSAPADREAEPEENEATSAREQADRPATTPKAKPRPAKPSKPAVVIREMRGVDGEQLRRLWAECGFRSIGDDDLSLARMARRNPGLLLVAAEGSRIVGSALGAWDGRRGWIYHVATAESHRRQGLASKLVAQVEAGLRDLGCPKVSVLVRDDNHPGRDFWLASGYEVGSRQYAKELRGD